MKISYMYANVIKYFCLCLLTFILICLFMDVGFVQKSIFVNDVYAKNKAKKPSKENDSDLSESFHLHLSPDKQNNELLYPLQEELESNDDVDPVGHAPKIEKKKKKKKAFKKVSVKKRKKKTYSRKNKKRALRTPKKKYRYYLMRKGDTLYSVAMRFKIGMKSLKKANRIRNIHRIRVGKRIRIPVKRGVYHIVKRGEHLRKIWRRYRKYRVSMSSLIRANQIKNPDYLQVGSVLWIPGALKSYHKKPKQQNFFFLKPIKGKITGRVGFRWHPVHRKKIFHSGVDIKAPYGYPVRSAQKGVIKFAGWKGGYGKLIIINHYNGMSTWYGHLSKIYMKKGQRIYRGSRIGRVGVTGITTGPHLHFEVRKKLKPQRILNRFKGLRGRVGHRWS